MTTIVTQTTAIILLFTEYLDDKHAITLLRSNKYIYNHVFRFYKCKFYYDILYFQHKARIPDLVRKLLLRDNVDSSFVSSRDPSHIKGLYYASLENPAIVGLFRNLTHLEFCREFNTPINNRDLLPNSITHLNFGNEFNQSVDHLPSNLTTLTFGRLFNQTIENLPSTLTHLTLGSSFNQTIDNLPQTLTRLILGESFNQKVDKLPRKLKYLEFGYCFNQPINSLPDSILNLTLGEHFNRLLPTSLPQVTHLTVSHIFNLSRTRYTQGSIEINVPQTVIDLKIRKILPSIEYTINFKRLPRLRSFKIGMVNMQL